MPLQTGDRIGRYVIHSLIGVGGMGEVYNAHAPQLNRDVAIKMLTGDTADDAGLRQRFEVEARAASTINHPNIVAVYDFGEQYGLLYIVWELVTGKTLRGIKFSARQTAEFGAQTLKSVDRLLAVKNCEGSLCNVRVAVQLHQLAGRARYPVRRG